MNPLPATTTSSSDGRVVLEEAAAASSCARAMSLLRFSTTTAGVLRSSVRQAARARAHDSALAGAEGQEGRW